MTEMPPTVWSCLRYDDADAARRFLVDVFGFRETIVVPDDDGNIVHAEARWPEGGGVMFGSTKRADSVHSQMTAGASSTYVVSDQVDAIYARVKAAGFEMVDDLTDTDYGSHGFTTRDPEGNLWSFGTYRGTP